jgi:acetylornithine deacetylase/succinyl-diaminopimelate desuccinylase family protein
MINKERLIKLTRDLIRIDSQNPPGDERKISAFLAQRLRRLGIKVKIYEFAKGRPNVIAYLKGSGKKSLLLTPHLDTVPAGSGWRHDPFGAKIAGNRMFGLGATDCKCNLSCSVEAISSIIEKGITLPYNLILAATADEESGSALGLMPLLKRGILTADAALVLDADDMDIIVTQKGLMHLKIAIRGKRAHGAYPDLGVNAIEIAAQVIQDLKAYKFPYRRNYYLKPPTVNAGTIKGGDKVNIVADWCQFELDFRFLPGTDYRSVIKILKEAIRKYTSHFKIESRSIQAPYSIAQNDPLVGSLKKAMSALGIAPRIRGSEGATVITFFQEKGIPAIATGFGVSSCAHTQDEFVLVSNLYKGALVLEEFLRRYRFKGE